MRGLLDRGLAQASGAASKAREVAGKARGQDAIGDSTLSKALRNITHTNSAAVPKEALAEALRLASESEENLAQVLRHAEDNVTAPEKEWRRIHGGLQLLDQLLRPTKGEALVGNIWFECKIQGRLKDLKSFTCKDDRRVTSLVQRAAANVELAFKKQKAKSAEDDISCSGRLSSERHMGGSSLSSDLDITCERHATCISPRVIGHESESFAPSHSPPPRILETLKPQTSPSRNTDIISTVPEEQCVALEADVCSDGESLMSRCCRCFTTREVRERVSPEEKMGLTVPDGSPCGGASS